ncbi:MAG: nickel/cobalt transporter [Thermomicrobiales bacterium]
MKRDILRRGGEFLAALAVVFALAFTRSDNAAAHPLGNFTVNQYTRIEATADGPRVVYILDLAEIPAFQEIREIDDDGNGDIVDTERNAYLDRTLAAIVPALRLTVDGEPVALRVVERDVTFPTGQAGLRLVRLRAIFAPVEDQNGITGPQAVTFENRYATDRLGWREIVVTHGAGIRLDGPTAPTSDTSDELRSYPADLLASPLDVTAASFVVTPAPGEPAAAEFARFAAAATIETGAETPRAGVADTRFAALLAGGRPTGLGLGVALLAAMAWGAVHALSPGHGKTVVGAYLVGSRGTPKHAAFLGLTVTITHTAGVIALGLVTLFASRYIVPERIVPWLSVASGALVVTLGLVSLRRRLAGHDHHHHHHHEHEHEHEHAHDHQHDDHSHLPPGMDGRRVSWRELLALGVSGGLIPCPSALVALLGAVALGQPGIGLALVVAFSLGLAGALTGLGLLFLYAGRFLERRIGASGRLQLVLRYGPVFGSAVLTLAGVAIVLRGLGEMGLG